MGGGVKPSSAFYQPLDGLPVFYQPFTSLWLVGWLAGWLVGWLAGWRIEKIVVKKG